MSTHPVSKVFDTVSNSALILLMFLFPLFFLPTTANFFEPNKLILLIIVTGITLLAWAGKTLAEKELRFTITPFTIPLFAIALVYLLSGFIASANPVESFLGRGTLYPALAFLSLFAVSLIGNKKVVKNGLYALIASATVLSFISIFQSVGLGLSTFLNQTFGLGLPEDLAFTPAGSPVALLSFVVPVLIATIIKAFTQKESLEKIVLFLLSAVMTAATVLGLLYSLPGRDTAPVFLPMRTGYNIAVETLKGPTLTSLLGYGPEQFVNAYNRTRPAALNLSEFWNIRFTSSSTELLQTVTATGVLGLAAWIALAVLVIKNAQKPLRSTEGKIAKFATVGLLFLFLLIPGTYTLIAATFFMLILWSLSLKFENVEGVREFVLSAKGASANGEGRTEQPGPGRSATFPFNPGYLFGTILILATIAVFYLASRAYAAEYTFKRSLDAAAENQGTETYNLQRQAIINNPYVSRYRRAYSATNLALANTISAGEELSDQDRQNVTQLIQQSIREAKAAVTLDPNNTANWESLILVYRNLINVAQGADQWTVASYAQAIQNDPVNPRLRLELGGVYYALGQYDQAIRLFQQAVELKPDWPNAYYNLSYAHRQKGELEASFNYMRQVAALVEPDSADFTKAQQELQALAEEINAEQPAEDLAEAETELNVPEPTPVVEPDNQVELPQEAGPQNINENPNQPVEQQPQE